MAKGCEMTPRKKSVCIALHNEGYSSRAIATRVGFNQSTVVRLLQKHRKTGDVSRQKGRGRKKSSTSSQDRLLKRLSLQDRRASSADLKQRWENATGLQTSTRTVRRRLFCMGLPARRPVKKPLLTTRMRQARLKWAREHQSWLLADWRKVIFSDESKFNLHGSDGKLYVRRRLNETYHPDCINTTVKHPAGQMVWGCISYQGVGRLHFIQGTVKAVDYVEILKEPLKRTIRDHFGSCPDFIFQDDSAPCHRAKLVSTCLHNISNYRPPDLCRLILFI